MAKRTAARLDTADIADGLGWQVESTDNADTFMRGAVVIEARYATDDDIESAVRCNSAGELSTRGQNTAATHDQLRSWLTGEDRRQQQVGVARSAGATDDDRAQLYEDFWRQFRNRVAAEYPDWKARAGTSRTAPNATLPGPSGRTLFVSAFKPGPLRLELAFVDPDPEVNRARFTDLHAKRDELERMLGMLLWDEMTGKKDTRVCIESSFQSIDEREQWSAMMDWLVEKHLRFKEAIEAMGGL